MKVKKILAVVLSVLLFGTLWQASVLAETENTKISVQSAIGMAGTTVDVAVSIENNPGVLGGILEFTFDSKLKLIEVTNGEAFSALTMTKPGAFASPCNIVWDGQEIDESNIQDGTILVLRFQIREDVPNGAFYDIRASYKPGDFIDFDLHTIDVSIENGGIRIVDVQLGNVNGDESINATDIIMLRRHIAGGYEQTIEEMAADVNWDGKINTTDIILLRRYIAGGYGITLPYVDTPQPDIYADADIFEGLIVDSYRASGFKGGNTDIVMLVQCRNGDHSYMGEIWNFECGDCKDAADYLGYYVTLYAKEDEARNDVVIDVVPSKNNAVLEIDAAQLDAFQIDDGDITAISFWADPADRHVTRAYTDMFSGECELFYNGRRDDCGSAIEFMEAVISGNTAYGKIKLLDNDNDGEYEWIFVTEYNENVVVGDINYAEQEMISAQDGSIIPIYPEDEDIIYTVYKQNGSVGTFADIKKDDVLTLSESDDGVLMTVFISNKTVDGTVTEVQSEYENSYKINGTWYKADDRNCRVCLGDTGTFYINIANRIVYRKAAAGGAYAYLFAADMQTSIGGTEVEFKFLDENGQWHVASLAPRVQVDGGGYSCRVDPATTDIDRLYEIVYGDIRVQQSLFKYELDAEDRIAKIYTAADRTGENGFCLDMAEEATYHADTKRIGQAKVEDETLVFCVPSEATDNEDRYIVTKAKYVFSDNCDYIVEMYDVQDQIPSVIVVYDPEKDLDESQLLIVTGLNDAINENGTHVCKIYGYQGGAYISLETSEDGYYIYKDESLFLDSPSSLCVGDAILYRTDFREKLDYVQVIMSASDVPELMDGYSVSIGNYGTAIFGQAIRKNAGNRLELKTQNALEANETVVFPAEDMPCIYKVDMDRVIPAVSVSSYEDISPSGEIEEGKRVDIVLVYIYKEKIIGAVVYTYTA